MGSSALSVADFIAFCLNITKSVAYHGFEKILIVNGHGSNTPLIDLIRNEREGIDVAFWFMEDARYTAELKKKKEEEETLFCWYAIEVL